MLNQIKDFREIKVAQIARASFVHHFVTNFSGSLSKSETGIFFRERNGMEYIKYTLDMRFHAEGNMHL